MKKLICFILISLFVQYYGKSSNSCDINVSDTTFNDDKYIDDIESRTSILLKNLYKGYTLKLTDKKKNANVLRELSDSLCIEMLNNMPSSIKLTFNKEVKKAIELMVFKRKSTVANVLNLGDIYFPNIEKVLDKYKLPLEIKYLTIIESGLNPTIKSRSGAGGLWQFMLPTARLYGLNVNSLVDERFDYVNSTEAACKLLSNLYEIYKDWWIVFAAYNCGTRYVNNAIKRANSSNFWDIYNYLPSETRKYIPSFIATYFAVYYHEMFGIYPTYSNTMYTTDYFLFKRSITFSEISKYSEVDEAIIRTLNPQFIRNVVPGNIGNGYRVRLPIEGIQKLDMMDEELSKTDKTNIEINDVGVKNEDKINTDNKKYHTVRKGETLATIAKKYRTTSSKLKKINKLSGNKIKVGQKIRVR